MTKKKAPVDPDLVLKQDGRDGAGTYTFENGRTVRLNRIGEAVLVGLSSETDKPKPPKREVEMLGGGIMRVDRSDKEPFLTEAEVEAIKDPKERDAERAYRQWRLDLQQWEMLHSLRFARTLFLLGVEDGPNADESAIWLAIGWSDPLDIKYFWLAYLCRDTETWGSFIEAIVSYSMPTEEGIEEMSELFRANVAGPPQQAVGVDLDVGAEAEVTG